MNENTTPTSPPEDPAEDRNQHFADRFVDLATRASARTERYTNTAQAWADRQEEHSRKGVALGWFGRYCGHVFPAPE